MPRISTGLLVLAMAGCSGSGAWPRELVGSYYCGDGLGFNLSLALAADGTYSISSRGCCGEYGRARGTWRGSTSELIFTAESEEGQLEGYLRSACATRDSSGVWTLHTNRDRMESAERAR